MQTGGRIDVSPTEAYVWSANLSITPACPEDFDLQSFTSKADKFSIVWFENKKRYHWNGEIKRAPSEKDLLMAKKYWLEQLIARKENLLTTEI